MIVQTTSKFSVDMFDNMKDRERIEQVIEKQMIVKLAESLREIGIFVVTKTDYREVSKEQYDSLEPWEKARIDRLKAENTIEYNVKIKI